MKMRIRVEGTAYDVQVDVLPEGAPSAVEVEPETAVALHRPPPPTDTTAEDRICRSPISGSIVSVSVSPGMRVRRDAPIAIIEAMKMQTPIGSPMGGVVESVAVKPGDAVKPGQILCRLQ